MIFLRSGIFQNGVATIDDKHVATRKHAISGSLYYKYMFFFSIISLAIVDYTFGVVVIGVFCMSYFASRNARMRTYLS